MLSSRHEPDYGCEEHERLFAVYARATIEYMRTIQVFHAIKRVLSAAQYQRLAQSVEDCHMRLQKARAALTGHITNHGLFRHVRNPLER